MSLTTLNVVSGCPTNELELSHAKQRKKCEHVANIQSCTKPNNFTYHCVLNTWTNATVEVCAPEMFSQGRLKICIVIFKIFINFANTFDFLFHVFREDFSDFCRFQFLYTIQSSFPFKKKKDCDV